MSQLKDGADAEASDFLIRFGPTPHAYFGARSVPVSQGALLMHGPNLRPLAGWGERDHLYAMCARQARARNTIPSRRLSSAAAKVEPGLERFSPDRGRSPEPEPCSDAEYNRRAAWVPSCVVRRAGMLFITEQPALRSSHSSMSSRTRLCAAFSSRPRSQIQAAVASRDHAAKTAINGIGTAVKVGGDGDADL